MMLAAEAKIARLEIALKEIQLHNRLLNDRDMYLYDIVEWGLGKVKDYPDPALRHNHDRTGTCRQE